MFGSYCDEVRSLMENMPHCIISLNPNSGNCDEGSHRLLPAFCMAGHRPYTSGLISYIMSEHSWLKVSY
jgi:hypothetical protein